MTTAHPQSKEAANRQARRKKDKALIAAIVALFASGAVGYGLLVGIRAALIEWGAPADIAAWLAGLASTHTEVPDLELGPPGPMQREEVKQGHVWRAVYIWGAIERLTQAPDLQHAQRLERQYFLQQVAAEERRNRAAALVDVTARLLGDREEEQPDERVPLLGWRATLDDRTTPECRWANGRNFRADRIPAIGLPGSVHPRCRCTSGPPVKGAPLMPSL